MQPKIETLQSKKLIGLKLTMSLAQNRTAELWRSFMPRRNEIKNRISNESISLQLYPASHFNNFSPLNEFEKWAAMEVSDFNYIPENMHTLLVPSGDYAVFHYKGSSTDTSIFNYIFSEWLPKSNYILDDRPHFEVLGEKYKNGDPTSEEDIYIPLKLP
jgi:AraC family transcriptional regulator